MEKPFFSTFWQKPANPEIDSSHSRNANLLNHLHFSSAPFNFFLSNSQNNNLFNVFVLILTTSLFHYQVAPRVKTSPKTWVFVPDALQEWHKCITKSTWMQGNAKCDWWLPTGWVKAPVLFYHLRTKVAKVLSETLEFALCNVIVWLMLSDLNV